MTTTIQLDPALMVQLQQRAAESGKSFNEFVEFTLRNAVGAAVVSPNQRIELPTFPGKGALMAGVDLNNSAALRDIMDEADGPLGR
jgi:hypothetical protein